MTMNYTCTRTVQALLAVGQELNLPTDGSLLAPVAAQEAPSFAAAPAFQAQLPADAGTHYTGLGRHST